MTTLCDCGHDRVRHLDRTAGVRWPCKGEKWCGCDGWNAATFVGDPDDENCGIAENYKVCACRGYDVPHAFGADACYDPPDDVRMVQIAAWRQRARLSAYKMRQMIDGVPLRIPPIPEGIY